MNAPVVRSAVSLTVMIDWAGQFGLTPRQCLAGTRLTYEALAVPGADVSARQELRAIANIVGALGDKPGLGLDAASRYPVTAYGMWGFAVLSSRTVGEALDVGLRFIGLTYAFCAFERRRRDGLVSVVVDASSVPRSLRRFVLERDIAAIPYLHREVVGTALRPSRMALALPDPGPAARHYEELFGVLPEFDATESRITFSQEQANVPLPQASPHTSALAEQQCRDLLARREARAGRAGQVRDILASNPSRPSSLSQVAAQLSCSARTLRRQLEAEGTSFRRLLDEVRQHLALELLHSGLSAEQVSARLGYTDVSNFSHAFHRWNGDGPRAYLASRRIS